MSNTVKNAHHSLLKISRRCSGLVSVAVLIIVSNLFWSHVAHAELRVIVQYDHTGHSLMRSVELPESTSFVPESNLPKLVDTRTQVKLMWFGSEGQVLLIDSIADPRLTHAPLPQSGQAPQVVGLTEGAYMVSGPLGSLRLEIQLPAVPSLGLVASNFQLDLSN